MDQRNDIRLALPSKGVLHDGALDFLESCGLKVFRPNPRQYAAVIPALPAVTVMFQRPSDIVTSVQQGSVDFGITGRDVLDERTALAGADSALAPDDAPLVLHEALGFGPCRLCLAVPEAMPLTTMSELAGWAGARAEKGASLRVATKFPGLTARFLDEQRVPSVQLVQVEGTLEIAPAIGNADVIVDLVSSGVTLRDNHLRTLVDGTILESEAILIANRARLARQPDVLETARRLLEYIEAHLRASGSYLVTANVRGESPAAIAGRMFAHATIGGLQGPTVSPVVVRNGQTPESGWFAVNIVVRKQELFQAIGELRAISGSGVIVAPCIYIFEEEPARYMRLLDALGRVAQPQREGRAASNGS